VQFAPEVSAERAGLSQAVAPNPACPGCPRRRLVIPLLDILALNLMYNGINQLRGHDSADITFGSMLANMKAGFEWDANDWGVNQIGHPYQGSNYFTGGRANGLTFWESSAMAALGSGTWEYFFENNRASLNDLINTTLGGIALGEVLHRTAWMIRNPARTDGRKEMLAMIVDPMGGLTRLTSGDFHRVVEKPADLIPSRVAWHGGAGVFWQGASLRQAQDTAEPYFDLQLLYGDARRGSSTMPYEAFTMDIAVGASLGETVIRGRLYGSPVGDKKAGQVTIFQTFDFVTNPAWAFGGQGFEIETAATQRLSSNLSLWVAAAGGATVLAAVDTLLLPPDGATIAPEDARRTYDYGPGPRASATGELLWTNGTRVNLSYQVFQVSVVDGTRATHVLQRAHLDVRLPLTRQLSLGATAEYFFRKAYFWGAGSKTDESPQFRVFLAWGRR